MIELRLQDGYVEVSGSPLVPEYLKKALGYWERVSQVVGFRREMKNRWRECFTISTGINAQGAYETMIAMPGMVGRIKKELQDKKAEFQVKDCRKAFPKPDIRLALQGMRKSQVACVYTALMSEGGIFAAATGFGKSHVIASLIRAYEPGLLQARGTPVCLVTAKDKDICTQNFNTLKKLFPDREVGIIMSGKTKRSDDILVVTLDSLKKVDMETVGLLIVDEVHEAATATRADELAKAIYARRWGASATPSGRFDGADLVTEGLVGPVIYQYTYQDGVRDGVLVPCNVLWLPVPEPNSIHIGKYIEMKNRLARYRHAAERNPGQNDQICEIIRRTPEEKQLLCIMQHVDQMNILAGQLPDVDCVHAVTDQAKLLAAKNTNLHPIRPAQRKKLYEKVKNGEIRKVMSTYVYKQGVDFPQLSIMIQAGGGGSKIASAQIPGRGSRLSEGKEEAYLVDFWHPWDKQLNEAGELVDGPVLRDDKARRRVYKKLGFTQTPIASIDDLPFIA